MNYAGAQEPERLSAARVTSNFFDVLHAQPSWDARSPNRKTSLAPIMWSILSYGLWQRRFGGRRDALGERMNLSGEMYAVVGVMPKDFDFPQPQRALAAAGHGARRIGCSAAATICAASAA